MAKATSQLSTPPSRGPQRRAVGTEAGSSAELSLVEILDALQSTTTSYGSRQMRHGHRCRARSLSPVRSTRPVRQVFGRLVEGPRGCSHYHEAAQVHQLPLSLNEATLIGFESSSRQSESRTPLTTDETQLNEDEESTDELSIQRSSALLRTVSYNLSRPAAAAETQQEAQRPCIQILYRDEALRAYFCKNAQQLITLVQSDSNTKTTSAFIAKKALKYRRASLESVGQVNTHDPTFDVSIFFGVEWRKAPDKDL